jgi:hypothetical protein
LLEAHSPQRARQPGLQNIWPQVFFNCNFLPFLDLDTKDFQ